MDVEESDRILKNIKNDEDIWKFIKDLYVQNYTYKSITYFLQRVYSDCTIHDIIKVLQYYDIKRCSTGDNCKSFNGPIQSRSAFAKNASQPDGLNVTCKECKSYYTVCKKANQEKKDQIDYFRSLNNVKDREDYIYDLYVNQSYTLQDVKAITLFEFRDVVDLIIGKFQIQRCINGDNCINSDGSLQPIGNFGKDGYRATGFSTICNDCIKKKSQSSGFKESKKRTIQKPAKFDTFAPKIDYAEEVRRDPDNPELLQVRCYNHKCKEWFNPTVRQVQSRVMSLNGLGRSISTACNFYCSQECKDDCPLFGVKAKDLLIDNNSIERMQSAIRRFKIETYGEPDHCDICGDFANLSNLILHHKYPVAIEHIYEADLDNLIWVCKECHNNAHDKDGCRTHELSELKNIWC